MLIVLWWFACFLLLVWAAGDLPGVVRWFRSKAQNFVYWLKGRR